MLSAVMTASFSPEEFVFAPSSRNLSSRRATVASSSSRFWGVHEMRYSLPSSVMSRCSADIASGLRQFVEQALEAVRGEADLVGELAVFGLQPGDATAQGAVVGPQAVVLADQLLELCFVLCEFCIHGVDGSERPVRGQSTRVNEPR